MGELFKKKIITYHIQTDFWSTFNELPECEHVGKRRRPMELDVKLVYKILNYLLPEVKLNGRIMNTNQRRRLQNNGLGLAEPPTTAATVVTLRCKRVDSIS